MQYFTSGLQDDKEKKKGKSNKPGAQALPTTLKKNKMNKKDFG
jgi:hypothetical protein